MRVLGPVCCVLFVLLLNAGCSGGSTTVSPSHGTAPPSLAPPSGVDPALWDSLQAELTRTLELVQAGRETAAVPQDERSRVDDLAVTELPDLSAQFSFSYRCTGDYDQNGEVNASDITPIALHFGATSAQPGWAAAGLADGDNNGEVNAADITPIALHYAETVGGYQLETSADTGASSDWQMVAECMLADATLPAGGGHLQFACDVAAPAAGYYRVVPFDFAGGELGLPSNTVYYAHAMLPAPLDVSATDGVYSDRITVQWTKVADAISYRVYRDSTDTPLATVGDVSSYDDTAVPDLLAHTYWVQAGDGAQWSNLSQPDAGFMSAPAPVLQPPTGVSASDGDYEDHIYVSWTKSLNATGYKIYRDQQTTLVGTVGDAAFYNDYSVADSFLHTYWVAATGPDGDSELSASDTGYRAAPPTGTMVVLAWNDLGMHCMNSDFSELVILPPYNVLHAQVIMRAAEPQIVTENVTVRYTIPDNTHSADKCNFWDYAEAIFGVALPPDIGLTGKGLAGVLDPLISSGRNDWAATGIPLTPINDAGVEDPYNLATVWVESGTQTTARTQVVLPVSWEISCELCHTTPGVSVATDILRKHDTLHGTDLEHAKPVLCGSCHPQASLGTAGEPGVPTLSSSMHTAHGPRMSSAGLTNECYACHPGVRTRCLRGVMFSQGKTCHDCHGTMEDVGNPARSPWVDEPRCTDCHSRAGFEFEQPGVLYRDSIGHNGVHCEACHGSPHAIWPTVVEDDNVQAITLQGHSGTIDTCTVCHTQTPEDPFNHTVGEGGGGDG